MRKADGKQYGYIIIPISIPADIDPEKNGEKRYSTGIVVEAMQMLGSKGDGQQAQRSEPEQASGYNEIVCEANACQRE